MLSNFEQAFKNNFFLTKEYISFCSIITNIKLNEQDLNDNRLYFLKNKNVSVNCYDEENKKFFREKNISFMSVLPEINKNSNNPSFFEYPIIFKTSYEQAYKNYKTSFSNGLREGKKFPHKLEIFDNVENNLLNSIYNIYKKQMKRHNSFIFPISYFHELMKIENSKLFTINYENNIIAYFFCFEYKDNFYVSIGGGNPDYFNYKPSNKLYDEVIRYACDKNLNIHLGIGEYNASYSKFKENVGAISFKCERFPDDKKLLSFTVPLLKFRLTGITLNLLSKIMPRKVLYLSMPFT